MTSTLADLEPEFYEELSFSRFYVNQSGRGSAAFPIKQAQKLPESGRAYLPGDPVNMIDWRAFGRSNQLIIRESHKIAAAKVGIFVDCGPSMHWPDETVETPVPATKPIQKYELALKLAFNLAYRHLRQQDQVAILPFREVRAPANHFGDVSELKVLESFALRSPREVRPLFDEFLAKRSGESFGSGRAYLSGDPAADLVGVKLDMAYFVSDLLFGVDQLARWMQNVRFRTLVHTLSSLELDTAWLKKGEVYFESSRPREYRGETLLSGEAYDRKLAAWIEANTDRARELAAHYYVLSDASSVGDFQFMMSDLQDRRRWMHA